MARILAAALIVVVAIGYVVTQLSRGVPAVVASRTAATSYTLPGSAPTMAWPSSGEAAFGVSGAGVLATSASDSPTPLASVTKLMTAYVILHDHPIGATGQGPQITVTATEVDTYDQDVSVGDSVVPVASGEQLSETQALEALLIPSGDNIATLLADWDTGSETTFVAKMNQTATALGLTNTHYADSSGVSPQSESTAADQVKLALLDMENATFRSIVAMSSATIPVAGEQYNIDTQLGKNGIIGIKTGFTTSAAGCFVFAANEQVGSTSRTVVGAVLHQGTTVSASAALTAAFAAAQALLASIAHVVQQKTVVAKGAVLGRLSAPWTTTVDLTATRSVSVIGLSGEKAEISVVLPAAVHPPVSADRRFGTVVVRFGGHGTRVPMVTSRQLPSASLWWRLSDV